MRLAEIADWMVDWKALRNPHADEGDRALGAVLADWVSGRHGRVEVQQKLLDLEPFAARHRAVSARHLYRGIASWDGLRRSLDERGWFEIRARPDQPLASWSSSLAAVRSFMAGYEDYVILRKPTDSLDVFLSLPAFDAAAMPFTRMAAQREVIVRMPPVLRVARKEVVESFPPVATRRAIH